MKNSSGCHDINKVIRFFLIPFKKYAVYQCLTLGESRRGIDNVQYIMYVTMTKK